MTRAEEAINNNTCHWLVGFEEQSAVIYFNLARHFRHNEALSWFWLTLAMEEKRRAELLNFCGCDDLFGDNLPDLKAIGEMSQALTRLEARSRANPSVDEAFLLAAELESADISMLYGTLVRPVKGTSYIHKAKVETLNTNHLQTIVDAAPRFGVGPGVLARLHMYTYTEPRRA